MVSIKTNVGLQGNEYRPSESEEQAVAVIHSYGSTPWLSHSPTKQIQNPPEDSTINTSSPFYFSYPPLPPLPIPEYQQVADTRTPPPRVPAINRAGTSPPPEHRRHFRLLGLCSTPLQDRTIAVGIGNLACFRAR
jgi:hypothetical protein